MSHQRIDGERAPRVTIGMPVYNGDDHVEEAIDSALAQTWRDLELVICDNASTDRTDEICRRLAAADARIRYYRNPENLGAAGNFRRCFELARGEFFSWLSHDDLFGPKYLERCVQVLDESPASVVMCFSSEVRLTYEGDPWRDEDRMSWYEANPPYDRVSFSRLMRVPDRRFPRMEFGVARRSAMARTSLIRPVPYSDLIYIAELRLLGEFREVPEPLFFRRSHFITGDFKDAKRRSVPDELLFYDPKSRSSMRTEIGAQLALLKARLDLVWSAALPRKTKLGYSVATLFGHAVIRGFTPFSMARLYLRNLPLRAWESVSAKLLRLSSNHYLFHRCWVLFAGLRHRDSDLVALAVSPSSADTRGKMQTYIASRLARRRDAHAKRLLLEWKEEAKQPQPVREP